MPNSSLKYFIFGGLAGSINAWLCYTGYSYDHSFAWHVIPAGFLHGGLLIFLPYIMYSHFPLYWNDSRISKHVLRSILGVFIVGYLSGWITWLPLMLSIDTSSISNILSEWIRFPLKSSPAEFFKMFGGVSALIFLALKWAHRMNRGQFFAACMLAGFLGSLYFWIDVGNDWTQSLMHGAIWGTSIGWIKPKII